MSAVQAQKKPGGAGVKLFQAILAVNRDPWRHAGHPVVDLFADWVYIVIRQ